MSKRRVANPLALAILACLAERPMHPYEMATTLRERHKDDAIKLNYGSLYSVIESLCKNEFIVTKETVRDGRRPERTIFELTASGHHELFDWLAELIAEPIKEYTHFGAGLSLLPVLPPEEAVNLLTRRCDMLKLALFAEKSVAEHTQSKHVARLFIIERELQAVLIETELKWTRALISAISDGSLDGTR